MQPLILFFKQGLYIYATKFRVQTYNCLLKECWNKNIDYNRDDLNIFLLSYPHRGVFKLYHFIIDEYELMPLEKIQKRLREQGYRQGAVPFFFAGQTLDEVLAVFHRVKQGIYSGDFYQLNLSFPFCARGKFSAYDYFLLFAESFYGDYFALIPYEENAFVLSFSPELFLFKERQRVITRPIKGTVDCNLAAENLLASEKEQAELSMIVDLLRNDLNRLAKKGHESIVKKHRDLLAIGPILHTFSEVEVVTDADILEILYYTFPGGSITGCPKESAMKHIEAFENYQRGFYTGSVGWAYKDLASFNILIRTFVQQVNHISYYAGCGIVSDSDGETEYREVLLKAQQLQTV